MMPVALFSLRLIRPMTEEVLLFVQEISDIGILLETRFNLQSRNSGEIQTAKSWILKLFFDPEYTTNLTLSILHLQLIQEEGKVLG